MSNNFVQGVKEFAKTSTGRKALYGGGIALGFAGLGALFKEAIKSFFKNRSRKKEGERREALEEKRHQNAMKEEDSRHKNDMELQQQKTQDKKDLLNYNHQLRKERQQAKDGNRFTDIGMSDAPLTSKNMQEIVSTPIPEYARIKLLEGTPVQNRDILLVYGTPGAGKSTLVIDMTSRITGFSTGLIVPTEEGATMPYKAFYFDKEMEELEWAERFTNRTDLGGMERISCRDSSIEKVLSTIKHHAENASTNLLFIIDPITYFDIKKKEIRGLIAMLISLQEAQLKRGLNLTFILIAHPVKSPKGKMLEDIGGAKEWSESVRSVASFMNIGEGGAYRMLKIEKAKNGREIKAGEAFILNPLDEPYSHFEYNAKLTAEYREEGSVDGYFVKGSKQNGNAPHAAKRRGKIASVPKETADKIQRMVDEEHVSVQQICDGIGKPYNLYPQEVYRLLKDTRIRNGICAPSAPKTKHKKGNKKGYKKNGSKSRKK